MPLQTLTGSLELALMRERSAQEYKAALCEAFSQSQRLSSLIQALLLLNQLETTPQLKPEVLNLTENCHRCLEQFSEYAKSRGVSFYVVRSGDEVIKTIPTHVDILLRNLFENAIKYALPNSEVVVSVQSKESGSVLRIVNHCHADASWDEARLFEPFYRPDASRNSDTGGNGLGLALCKAVANANDWRITLRRELDTVIAHVAF